MIVVPYITRGDDWEWKHTVTFLLDGQPDPTGTLVGSRISMTWKYYTTDPDSAAAAKITSDPGGGITVLSATEFACAISRDVTTNITPGSLYVDVQYESLGKTKTEKKLDRNTKCFGDVTRDIAT